MHAFAPRPIGQQPPSNDLAPRPAARVDDYPHSDTSNADLFLDFAQNEPSVATNDSPSPLQERLARRRLSSRDVSINTPASDSQPRLHQHDAFATIRAASSPLSIAYHDAWPTPPSLTSALAIYKDPRSIGDYRGNNPDARFRLRLGARAAMRHVADQSRSSDRSTSAVYPSSEHGQYYRASPKSFSSPLVSSYVRNTSSRSHGRRPSSIAYSDDDRESVLSGAASTVWDDIDQVKSRLKRLETASRTGDDAMSIRGSRVKTATTEVTSSQPLRVTSLHASPARTLDANVVVSTPQRRLQASVAHIHADLDEDLFRALDSAADDAIAVSTIADNLDTFTGLSPEVEMNFRRLRRKADDLCHNMTELCSALAGQDLRLSLSNEPNHYSGVAPPNHFNHTPIQAIVEERRRLQSRAESRLSVVSQSQLVLDNNPRRHSLTIRPHNPQAADRYSAASRTANHLDLDPRPISRAMTEYGAAYRSPRQARRPMPNPDSNPAPQSSIPRTPQLEHNLSANRASFESNNDINLLTPRPTPSATFAAPQDHARYIARPVSAASTSLAERVRQRRRERTEQVGDGYSIASVNGVPGLAR